MITAFYVQDERYDTVPWLLLGFRAYAALVHPCTLMAKSVDVQDERYDAMPWLLLGFHVFAVLIHPVRR